MKAMFSEKYYRDNWEKFMEESKDSGYMNLEEELEYSLKPYAELPKEVIDALIPIKAKEIADKATEALKATMEIVKGIQEGTKSLGYNSRSQEAKETHRYITRFEFNCIQLADFKKKYI